MLSRRSGRPRRWVFVLVGLALLLVFGVTLLGAIHTRGLGAADDAFISYRIARNVAQGFGLSFNPEGPRVEAASNFLLTMMLAGAHRADLSLIRSSLVISLASTVMTLLLLAWCVRRTAGGLGLWAPFAMATMTVVCRNVTNGLETSLFGLLLLAAVALYVLATDGPRPNRRLLFFSSLVFALVALTRPEGPMYMLALGLLRGWDLLGRWRAGRPLELRTELYWVAGFALLFLPYTLWRVTYFEAWLPNTYHAKEMQFAGAAGKLAVGGNYLKLMVLFEPLLPIALLGGALAQVVAPDHRRRALLAIVITQSCFMVLSGGDWPHMFEFGRFLYPVLPLVLWLLADAGAVLVRLRRRVTLGLMATAVLALTQVDLVELVNPQMQAHYHFRVRTPLTRDSLAQAYIRELPRLSWDDWVERSTQTWAMTRYHNNFDAAAALWLRDRYGRQARVASIQAGQFAFWCEMPFFDMFGLVTPAVTQQGDYEIDALADLIAAFDPTIIAFYKHGGGVHHRHLALDGALGERGYGLRYVIQRKRFRAFIVFEKGYHSPEDPREILFASMEDLPKRINRDRWIASSDPNNASF